MPRRPGRRTTVAALLLALLCAVLPAPAGAAPVGAAPAGAAPVDTAPVETPAGTAPDGTPAPEPAAPVEPAADGAGAQTWAVVPASSDGPDGRGRLEHTVQPGSRTADQVAVRNLGTGPLTVTLYAQDGEQRSDGSFEVLNPEEEARRVGAWVHLEATSVTVPARSSVVVPFVLDVPPDAEPGDWAGGILAAGEPEERTDGPAVGYAAGTRLYVRVAGPAQAALAVSALSGGYDGLLAPFAGRGLHVDAALANTGNVRLAPEAVVRVRSLFGLWTTTAPLDAVEEILPGGGTATAATVSGVPPLGPLWVTVDVTGATSRGQDLTGAVALGSPTVVVWAVPWTLLGAVLLLALAGVLLLRRQHARRAASRPAGRAVRDAAGAARPGPAAPAAPGTPAPEAP